MADLKTPEKKVEAPKKVLVRATLGDIVHPFTDTRFVLDASKPHERDAWIDVQLEAGKIELTE